MNQKKARKEAFFKAHPFCCFCGGSEPATTEDHIPGRTIFDNRIWPEGFVFPACEPCNKLSSDDEIIVALIARITERRRSDFQYKEFQSKLHEFTKQHPELRKNINLFTRSAEKRIIESFNLSPWNSEKNHPIKAAAFPRETFTRIENFGKKLGKALHYLHTKKIFPRDGVVNARAITNAQINLVAEEFFEITSKAPANLNIVRSAQPLTDQFVYRYAIDPDTLLGVYIVAFGIDAVLLVITVEPTPGLLPKSG